MNVNDLKLMCASTQVSYLCSLVIEESNKYFPFTSKHINSGDIIATLKQVDYIIMLVVTYFWKAEGTSYFLSPVQRELQWVPECSKFTSLSISW